jgi:hypothetical protein
MGKHSGYFAAAGERARKISALAASKKAANAKTETKKPPEAEQADVAPDAEEGKKESPYDRLRRRIDQDRQK